MATVLVVWDFMITNIFRNPPVLIGLIACLGLCLQKKPIEDVFKGSVLAALGLYMLTEGTGFSSSSIATVNIVFRDAMGVQQGTGLDSASFIRLFGAECGMIMFFGLILHLLIARFTPIKTIYLTGHFLWWWPVTFCGAGIEAGMSGVTLIAFGAVCSALYWSFTPWLLRKYVWDVTEDKSWLLAHPTGILSMVSGTVAKFVGDKSKTSADLKIPKRFSFLKEIPIVGFFVIFTMYIVLEFSFGGAVSAYTETPIFTYALNMGLRFGVGLLVMLNGVRMLINQIVPAFEGISSRLIPNAIPGYDCPLMFGYRPNALIFGFLIAIATTIPLIIICNVYNVFGLALLPLIGICFFEMGTAAIIADGQGGVRGMILGTIAAGVVVVLLAGCSAIVFSNTMQNRMLTGGGNDQGLYGIIATFIGRAISPLFGFEPLPFGANVWG